MIGIKFFMMLLGWLFIEGLMVDFWMIDGVWLGVFVFIGDGVFFFFFILEII